MPYDYILVVSRSSLTLPMMLASAGGIFWLIAYVLMIRKGFQDSTYGIPLLAIMLNFTWEIIYATIHAPSAPGDERMRLAWLALDIPNVWLLSGMAKPVRRFRTSGTIIILPSLRHSFCALLGI